MGAGERLLLQPSNEFISGRAAGQVHAQKAAESVRKFGGPFPTFWADRVNWRQAASASPRTMGE
jgi:hypothetical protein